MGRSSSGSLANAMGEGKMMGSGRSVMKLGNVYGKLQRRTAGCTLLCEPLSSVRLSLFTDVADRYVYPLCRYDVSGVPPDKIEEIIKFDWKHLVYNKRIFDSPSYLREKGKPVVALWGTNHFSLSPVYRVWRPILIRGFLFQVSGSKTRAIRPVLCVQSLLT